MQRRSKIQIGIGIVLITVVTFTTNYIMKQIKLLMDTSIDLTKTQINKISFKRIELTLWWEVGNKSDIGANISGQIYDIYLNDKFIKRVGNADSIDIKPKSKAFLPVYVSITYEDFKRIGLDNVTSLLTPEGRRKLNLKVKGRLDIKTSVFQVKRFPFEYNENIQALVQSD